MKKSSPLIAALALILFATHANALVLCTSKKGVGGLKVREECKKREVEVDPSELGLGGGSSTSGIILRDTNGVYIGQSVAKNQFVREIGGRARIFIADDNGGFEEGGLVTKYESTDCTGPQLINEETERLFGDTRIWDGTLFYKPIIGEGTQTEIFSELWQENNFDNVTACNNLCSGNPGCTSVFFTLPHACCMQFTAGKMEALSPAGTFDVSQFQEPFHVEVISPE